MAKKITITINEKTIEVLYDTYLLNALREAQVDIPTLCHHHQLTPDGNCRLCVCEVIDKAGKKQIVTSCNYPVREEITVFTHSEKIQKHRRLLAEMLLSRWPQVPIIQGIAKKCGVKTTRFQNELTDENPKACVMCGRCVRACKEFALEKILEFAGKGITRHLTMPFGKVDSHCVGCSSCAYVCPTGAIEIVDDLNHPVEPKRIRDHGMKVNAEMATLDSKQCRMRQVGTANIVDVMDKYDLLPVMNFKFGSHPNAKNVYSNILRDKYLTQGKSDGCWQGCSMACAKVADNFVLKTGPYKGHKVAVDGPEYETVGACTNMGCFDPEFTIEFNFYCDTYGIDTISMGTTFAFAMEAFEKGIITTKDTGGLDLHFGAQDSVLELMHQMARGEGFGVEVGHGIRWLKNKWIANGADPKFLWDIGMEVKGLEYSQYVSKESLAQQGGYALAIKGPQHDEAWLIFMDMVNNQIPTFEHKAEALNYFPLWRTWFGLFGLCKIVWNDIVPADNYKEKEAAKIPDHVRNYFNYVQGMTGISEMTEKTMLQQSGRVYNLERVIARLLGFGTRKDDMPPYRSMGPVTVEEYESRAQRYDKQLLEILKVNPEGKTTAEKVQILREHREKQYSMLVDAVYERRGWTKNGVPKISRLQELGIDLPQIVEIVRKDQE